MGDFNHGNIQCDTLECTGVEDQQFPHSTCIGTNQRSKSIRFSSVFAEKIIDNFKIQKPLGSSEHNQLHLNINIKSDKTKISRCRRNFGKGNIIIIRK